MADGKALKANAQRIIDRELQVFDERTPGSMKMTAAAKRVMPKGVASNFQYYNPHPVVVARAQGSRMWDVDGNEYIDYNMAYGSLLAGHSHPKLVEAVQAQTLEGTLYTSPSPLNLEVAEELTRRFAFEMVRFTNSGTESTMDAIRLARGYTNRDKIIKAEGCYHGHHDAVMVSVKPELTDSGPAAFPSSVAFYYGVPRGVVDDVLVVPYNDLDALERMLAAHPHEVACYILEPVPENIGIVLPEPGYLEGVLEICHRYGTLVIFDEVKTGITAHPRGVYGVYGLLPDIVTLAKSIGGGVPLGTFGARSEIMDWITKGIVTHQGTFNGNPLVMAAARAVLKEICTDEAFAGAEALNDRLLSGCRAIIEEAGLPAHTVQMGAKGCVTYSPTPVRNYRDYTQCDADLAYANWVYNITHGILLPPGLDEQWLVSVQHSQADIDHHLEVFSAFVTDLTA